MKKLLFLIISSSLFLGCGTGLKSGWGNFTAYYNTYYNAKKSYESGLKKVLDANPNYNPQQPIRIHEVPINAGTQDFDKAIEKGAEILRKHDDTKWVDNSLLLIGKSYFFKKDYFSADQKFDELILKTEDQKLIIESVLWRSRTLLEMELYGQGIQYINQNLNDLEGDLKPNIRAELEIILAQFHVAQENWEQAIRLLDKSLNKLSSIKYKERGYFLLGQLNERQGDYREAFRAYNTVQNHYSDYDLQYLSLRKTAETARLLGDNDTALSTFNKMKRDDKNTEFISDLNYEIARTYQAKQEYSKAETVYKEILNSEINQPNAETKALIYNGLAEVYRFGYDDFEMAAAYYDTASQQNVDLDKLPISYNASELAVSFGEYSEIKNEISNRDSLIWVSNLSEEKLDSLVSEIKKRKLAEIEEARKNQEDQQNTLVNVNTNDQTQTNTGNNGFLNVNSPELIRNTRTQFLAVWGNRPLVDNWRVESLIESAVTSDITNNTSGNTDEGVGISQTFDTSVDLSEVPFQQEQKEEMKLEIATLKYELGNLFYISLSMPDSASKYFNNVITNHPKSDKVAVSYYSLSEIQSLTGQEEKAYKNAQTLINEYPNSRYAVRLAEKYELEISVPQDTLDQSMTSRYESIKNDTSLSELQKAETITELALSNTKTLEAAPVLFEAIQMYIKLGKRDSIYQQNYQKWISAKKEAEIQRQDFSLLKDSLRTQLNDTSLTEVKRAEINSLIDSSFTEPSYEDVFPYYGDNWEKARININLFLANFRNSELVKRVEILKAELAKPKKPEADTVQNPEVEPENSSVPKDDVVACSDLESPPEVRGGIEAFINQIDGLENQQGSLTYKLSINQRGIVEDFELTSSVQDQRLVGEFNNAIQERLTFNPAFENGQAIAVTCNFEFRVN